MADFGSMMARAKRVRQTEYQAVYVRSLALEATLREIVRVLDWPVAADRRPVDVNLAIQLAKDALGG